MPTYLYPINKPGTIRSLCSAKGKTQHFEWILPRKLLFHFLLLPALIYFSWSARKHKLWTLWLETGTYRVAPTPFQWEMFRPFCPLCLFLRDILKDSVLIGPCYTFLWITSVGSRLEKLIFLRILIISFWLLLRWRNGECRFHFSFVNHFFIEWVRMYVLNIVCS